MRSQDEILKKMNDLKIEGIKVFAKSKRVEINAACDRIIPIQEVVEIEDSLKECFDGCGVSITVRCTGKYSLQQIIEEYNESIVYELCQSSPSLKGIFADSIWEAGEGNKVRIKLASNGTRLLTAKNCGSFIEDKIRERFAVSVKAEFISRELDEESRKKYIEFKESEEQKALSALILLDAAAFAEKGKTKAQGKRQGSEGRSGVRSETGAVSVIKGTNINEEAMLISDISPQTQKAVLRGDVFKVDFKVANGKKNICIFLLTDYSSSYTVKYFYNKEDDAKQKELISPGLHLKVRGDLKYDNFLGEPVLMARDIVSVPKEERIDDSEEKRVELHCHTKMSAMDGIASAEDLIRTAAGWGHKAIAITDHGVVQAFPEAYNTAKAEGIKVIYGVECYLLDDAQSSGGEEKSWVDSNNFVVIDIETTGLSPESDRITEIGAVRVIDGCISKEFNSFVNPGIPIPAEITKLTGITDEMVRNAPDISYVLPELLEFIGSGVIVAHNATFDMSFIKKAARNSNIRIKNQVVDTLQLSRKMLPHLKSHRLEAVAGHLKIDMGDKHRAKDDANTAAQILIRYLQSINAKVSVGLVGSQARPNGKTDLTKYRSYHAVILVKNAKGLRNLYQLVSQSHLEYYNKRPRIPRSLLMNHREGLLLTTACEAGELFSAIIENNSRETLKKIVQFYDVLEIQPLLNNRFLISSGKIESMDHIKEANMKIVELGESCGKPVIATGDVHFLNPQDEVFRRILMVGQGYPDAEMQAPLYLRTTEDMLKEFDYLGEEKAYEVVITNTNAVADMIEDVIPVPEGTFPPEIEGSDEQLKSMSESKARQLYGDPLPQIVSERMGKELNSIVKNGFAVMYVIAQKLVQKSLSDGYLVGSRGSVGSSLVANMAGITEVNSLPPHYLCGSCKYSEFITDGSVGCGFDLPDKKCPNCGSELKKDGHDIPFETFLGFDGDKEPDIDLNFSGEYQPTAHKYIEELFGEGYVYRAGTISTLANKTAFGFVKGYLDDKGIRVTGAEIERLIIGCTGIKKTTGQHPGGVMIVPHNKDIYEFTPIQRPADDKNSNIITTHFDYHSISGKLLKLDILGHDDPTVIKMLEDLTGVNARTVPMDDKQTMGIFNSTDALGISPEQINSQVGTFGVPEFGTSFVRQILIETKPTTFSELVRIAGLSHGTDVWSNNAQDLILSRTATLSEVICVRDDIMLNLVRAGLEPKTAFKISEDVRKGKGLTADFEKTMKLNMIPDWYVQSCKKIKYMFPKAHSAAYVTMAFRIAWFKVYYPEAFYVAYYTVRADDFDAELMCGGPDRVKTKIEEIQQKINNGSSTPKERNTLPVLEVVNEMYARGIKFLPVDLYKSDIRRFEITPEGIRPPLNALQGLGLSAAQGIDRARLQREFLSKEDLSSRARISNAVIKILTDSGCLEGLPESSQLSLF